MRTASKPAWLREICELRARKGIDSEQRLLLEGLRVNRAAHDAGVTFERVVHAPEFYAGEACARLVASLADRDVPVHRLAPREFSRLSYKAEGVIGVARFAAPALAAVLRAPLVLVLDGLSDPGNVGAVLRTANAWSASVVVVDGEAKLYHPKALRASMGSLFHTPTCAVSRDVAVDGIAQLRRPVVVLQPDADRGLDTLPYDREPIVVLGNEKRGVHPRWLAIAADRVAVPMGGVVDSVNVATAAAIVLWEAFRRR